MGYTIIPSLFKYVAKNYTAATVTGGSVTEELLHSLQIPAGVIQAGDVIDMLTNWNCSATANTKNLRVYWNSGNTLAGAVLLALWNANTSNSMDSLGRIIAVESNTSVLTFAGNGRSSFSASNTAVSSTAVASLSAGGYFLVSGQKGVGADTLTLVHTIIRIIKSS